jgi:hypothetical protein
LDFGGRPPYTRAVAFRDRLFATLRSLRPVLEEPGVLIVGSEVPNLLQPGAASTLVVSQDVDIGVPVACHAAVKRRVGALSGFRPSAEEPSVLVPERADQLEVNFVGMDPARDPSDTYVLEDPQLPLMVFGPLSLVKAGRVLEIEGARLPLPRPAGLILEKLVTDRTGEKGDRDLLVALGLLMTASPDDLRELDATYRGLRPELRHVARSSLTLLSLMAPRPGMPDPRGERARVAGLLRRLEAGEPDLP